MRRRQLGQLRHHPLLHHLLSGVSMIDYQQYV
jgi:hypothetical protein